MYARVEYLVFFYLLDQIRDELRATFRSGVTRPLEWRKHQLHQLVRLAQNEANAICDALALDFAKPRFEVMGEVMMTVERTLISVEQLEEWNKPEQPDIPESQKSWKPTWVLFIAFIAYVIDIPVYRVYKAPLGTVLVIS